VRGSGAPCQPRAFVPHEKRLALAEGVTAFPRHLSRGLDIRLNTLVTSIQAGGDDISVQTAGGENLHARDVVVAFALEQSAALLRPLGKDAEGLTALVGLFSSIPCLAVAAGYRAGTSLPDWHVWYPEGDTGILMVSNESSKRTDSRSPVFVIQGSARWSRRQLESPQQEWSAALLAAAARLIGPWAGSPEWTHPHRWRYSRLDPSNELAAPVVAPIGRARIGLAGDLFSPGGGIQAAWVSGDRLAMELLGR
jgi:hypothetical protein